MTNKKINEQHDSPHSVFQYTVSDHAGRVKPKRGIGVLMSPKYASKTKMYTMFVLGSICLIGISYIAVNGVTFYGNDTYISYIQEYLRQNSQLAPVSLLIMAVVNIFWIIINSILEFLAINRGWIPPKQQSQPEVLSEYQMKRLNQIFISRYTFDELGYRDMLKARRIKDNEEDEEEFEAVLHNPFLSPFAYMWIGVKKIYRTCIIIPDVCFIYWMRFLRWNERIWFSIQDTIMHAFEIILYFLNPIHLIEEVIDTAITILVKVLYPAIITPVIFFIPVRYGIYIENPLYIIIYFLLIACLRLGVAFFSIYIRYLRNSRAV